MSNLLEQASLVMIPSGYKEDVVYSEIPLNGAGDLSFTRASNGTRINSAGLVEVCPWNFCDYSEDQTQWTSQNETTVTANSTTAPNGTTTADTVTPSTANDDHYRGIVLGQQVGALTAFIYVKPNGYNFFDWGIYNSSQYIVRATFDLVNLTYTFTNAGTATIESVGNGWLKCGISGTNASLTTMSLYYRSRPTGGTGAFTGNGTSGAFIWGAQLNIGSTAKPYFPTTDRLNVPRLTYQNGGGGCPSLLLEPQRTNLLTYSEEFDNANWTKAQGNGGTLPIITANYAISPDGTQNADRIQLTRTTQTSSFSYVYQTYIGTIGVSYTWSIWLKSLSGTPSVALSYDGSSYVNIVTLTTEWQRYTFTSNAINTSIQATFLLFQNLSGTSLSADFLAWGFQLEASSYPTSYIPTTSSSATRVADVYSRSLSSIASGTAYVNITDNVALETPGTHVYGPFAITSASLGLYLSRPNNQRLRLWTAAANNVFQTTQTNLKLAITWDGTNVNVYQNGVKVVTNYSYALTNVNNLFSSTLIESSATIAEIALFNSVLTDAECISLTS